MLALEGLVVDLDGHFVAFEGQSDRDPFAGRELQVLLGDVFGGRGGLSLRWILGEDRGRA